MTHIYWMLGSKPYNDIRATLVNADRKTLEDAIINQHYNSFLSQYADFGKEEVPLNPAHPGIPHGKRIPYIGWFWRATDWANGRVSIGNSGEFIGVMENNKWDYPERNLTPEEFQQVISIIDSAIAASKKGGNLADIIRETNAEVEKLWPLFQTFEV